MKNIFTQIKTYGISSNILKIIAVSTMFIDHIGLYFAYALPSVLVEILRSIGRISMPLFVFLLVQGFFKTKNYKKYILRISIFAIVTQVVISIAAYFNVKFFSSYIIDIYKRGNILFSFVLTLLTLKVIHENIIFKKYTREQNILVRILSVLIILSIYLFIPLEYDIVVPILAVLFYGIERFRIKVLMTKNSNVFSIGKFAVNIVDERTINRIYKGIIFASMLLVTLYTSASFYILLAIIPIMLYNDERNTKHKYSKWFYYIFFPAHHVLLYVLAFLLFK